MSQLPTPDIVGFYPSNGYSEPMRVISDESGLLALIATTTDFSGDFDADPDDPQQNPTSRWQWYEVAWSRSGTAFPAVLRSADLEATCAAVAAWEADLDPERQILIEDHRDATRRAELACAELAQLERGGDAGAIEGAFDRARMFLTAKVHLDRRLRDELEAFADDLSLPRAFDTAGRDGADIEGDALAIVCRESVLSEAVTVLNSTGVTVSIRPDLLSKVAANLQLPVHGLRSLWPSSDAMRGEILLSLAREGLTGRADDETLVSTWHYLSSQAAALATGEGRREVLRRLVDLVAQHNFENVTTSMAWRNYVACSVSVAETDELSSTLTAELRRSEEDFLAHMAPFYENLLGLIGFRLSPRLRQNHQAFALSLAAVVEGLGIVRRSVPGLLSAGFGDKADSEQSLASLLVTVLLEGLIEEDPDYDAESAIRRLTHGLEFEVFD
ncbi:hypothetical protein VD659_15150 [Herbiconiux sp. 11R-BC]|uniref:hypothetical protein n=1 Tax=Herbiconiux sp. 11R-BC TaxID=3111637 RepID=UPI003C08223C